MKIGIDGNLLTGKKTGMGFVVENVIKFWKADNNTEIILYVRSNLDSALKQVLESNGIKIHILKNCNYFKWEQRVLPKAAIQDRLDILWCPYNTAPAKIKCDIVVTVHDMIYFENSILNTPTLYKKFGIIYRRIFVPRAIKKSKELITVSNYAKSDILQYFPYVKDKIHTIYNGVSFYNNLTINENQAQFFKRNNINKSYILAFGSLEKRKNTGRVIEGYLSLPTTLKDNYQLVLFGFRGYKDSQLYLKLSTEQKKKIRFLGYISEEEKYILYRNAMCFAFPSISEGFGIPILEAFSAHIPVITSNISALPEIAGNGAVLVNPYKVAEIRDAMRDCLINESLRKKLILEGNHQLSKFNWEKASQEYLKLIKGGH